MLGIDISEFQDSSIIEKVNPEFVLIRAGYGKTEDGSFRKHVEECRRLCIPFGVYWYSYALTVKDAQDEAAACLKTIKDLPIKMGVWFDMEDGDQYKLRHGFKYTSSNIDPICYEFASIIEDAGYYSGIYVSESWLKYLKISCQRFDKWVARWGSNSGSAEGAPPQEGSIWQFTSKYNGLSLDADISEYGPEVYGIYPAPSSRNEAVDLIEDIQRKMEQLKELIV